MRWRFMQVAACTLYVWGCGVSDPALLADEDAGADTGSARASGPVGSGGTAGSGGMPGSGGSGAGGSAGSMSTDAAGGQAPDAVVNDGRPNGDGDASLVRDGSADTAADTRAIEAAPPDVCPPNACGGCGALSGTVGGNCGTCGKYVCDTTTTLKCDDPGLTNMCPTWCTTHPAPAGVAAGDYQCLDFDNAMAPAGTWPTTVTGTGSTLTRSNARASSPMYSLMSGVSGNQEDEATIAWNDVGATPVTSISVSAAINPTSQAGVFPPSNGGMDVLCVATGGSSGGNRTCLDYTVDGNGPSGANFTGFYIYWSYVGGAAVAGQCPLSVTNLTPNIWNTVTLSITVATHAVDVTINGTTATSNCAAQISADTVAKVTVGATTHSFNTFNWAGYFDNIQATVHRSSQ